jgi:hypothetical protein
MLSIRKKKWKYHAQEKKSEHDRNPPTETQNISNRNETRRPNELATLPGKNLDNAIATCTDNKSPISAPNNAANAFAAHDTMASKLLHANALFKVPESNAGVVACGDCFTAVLAKRKGGDG